MHRKKAEAIFYIISGITLVGLMGFIVWASYLALTNPN